MFFKKVALCLCAIMFFVSSSVCFASISVKNYKYENIKLMRSQFENIVTYPPMNVTLMKGKQDNTTTMALSFDVATNNDWWFFEKSDVKFEIGDKIYSVPVAKTYHEVSSSGLLFTNCDIYEIDNIIELLKTAEKVNVQINFKNHPSIEWEVPQNVISEWKQVINTEI